MRAHTAKFASSLEMINGLTKGSSCLHISHSYFPFRFECDICSKRFMSFETAQACLNYHIQICLTPQLTHNYNLSVSQSPPALDTTLPFAVDEWGVDPTDFQPQASQLHSGDSMYFLKFKMTNTSY